MNPDSPDSTTLRAAAQSDKRAASPAVRLTDFEVTRFSSVDEAAEILGVCARTVYDALRTGAAA